MQSRSTTDPPATTDTREVRLYGLDPAGIPGHVVVRRCSTCEALVPVAQHPRHMGWHRASERDR